MDVKILNTNRILHKMHLKAKDIYVFLYIESCNANTGVINLIDGIPENILYDNIINYFKSIKTGLEKKFKNDVQIFGKAIAIFMEKFEQHSSYDDIATYIDMPADDVKEVYEYTLLLLYKKINVATNGINKTRIENAVNIIKKLGINDVITKSNIRCVFSKTLADNIIKLVDDTYRQNFEITMQVLLDLYNSGMILEMPGFNNKLYNEYVMLLSVYFDINRYCDNLLEYKHEIHITMLKTLKHCRDLENKIQARKELDKYNRESRASKSNDNDKPETDDDIKLLIYGLSEYESTKISIYSIFSVRAANCILRLLNSIHYDINNISTTTLMNIYNNGLLLKMRNFGKVSYDEFVKVMSSYYPDNAFMTYNKYKKKFL